jgi:hypothetical protein
MMDLIELHTLDGNAVQINPATVVSLREPQTNDKRVTHHGVQCIVNFVDGKFISVVEPCLAVRLKLTETK